MNRPTALLENGSVSPRRRNVDFKFVRLRCANRTYGSFKNLLIEIGAMDPVTLVIAPEVMDDFLHIDRDANWSTMQDHLIDILATRYPQFQDHIQSKIKRLAGREYD
ncbi:hypothetical protein [Candidatus Methylomicrobium oryzae]|uniref:hypothetical protein n=1 Tax=Candidatus Methylomicrobium oryzae TaxID=2802053 RepID=UPI001F2808AF|nr:hypothetical protein [Methylomicrobium sp. RS1]